MGASTQTRTGMAMQRGSRSPDTHACTGYAVRDPPGEQLLALTSHGEYQQGQRSRGTASSKAGKCSLGKWRGCMIPRIWNYLGFRKEFGLVCHRMLFPSTARYPSSSTAPAPGGSERWLRSNPTAADILVPLIFFSHKQFWVDFFLM